MRKFGKRSGANFVEGVRLHRSRDRRVSIFDRSSYALFIISELFEKNNDGRGIEVWDKKKKF